MNKIALIIPYFTTCPPIWMGLNFYTCSKQNNIDFVYFTDSDEIINLASKYPNIICHKVSFVKYCENASKHLGVDFHPQHAYKLCDLRPFYGFIHQDMLKQYDFWGYGDNDLIYGNLNVLTNQDMLQAYDVITTMSERIAGHFAIFRNNDKYRMLGFKCPRWKEHLLSSEHVGFDESDWVRLVLPEKRLLTALFKGLFKPFMSYERWVKCTYRLYSNKWNRKFIKEMFTTPVPKDCEIWTYDNQSGKIIAPDGKTLPYLHFLFFKKTKYLETDKYWKDDYWKVDNRRDFSEKKCIYFSLDGVKEDRL